MVLLYFLKAIHECRRVWVIVSLRKCPGIERRHILEFLAHNFSSTAIIWFTRAPAQLRCWWVRQ